MARITRLARAFSVNLTPEDDQEDTVTMKPPGKAYLSYLGLLVLAVNAHADGGVQGSVTAGAGTDPGSFPFPAAKLLSRMGILAK